MAPSCTLTSEPAMHITGSWAHAIPADQWAAENFAECLRHAGALLAVHRQDEENDRVRAGASQRQEVRRLSVSPHRLLCRVIAVACRRDEGGAVGGIKAQRLCQPSDRRGLWRSPDTAFEVRQPAHAHAGSLGQGFLR